MSVGSNPATVQGDNGIQEVTFGLPHSWIRLNVKYTSDD